MKMLRSFVVLIVSMILLPQLCQSQWQQTSGPYGIDVHAVTSSGDTLYAATGGGFYQFTPGAKDWQLLSLNSKALDNVWTTPSQLFTTYVDTIPNVSSGPHLLRSSDHGDTWSSAGGVFSHSVKKFWAFASIRDSGKAKIYISASFVTLGGTNFFSSSDNGDTWIPVTSATGLPSLWVHGLATIGDTLFAATAAGLYEKIPGAPKWSRVTAIPSTVIAYGVGFSAGTLYVGTSDGTYQSNDRVNWSHNPNAPAFRSFSDFGGQTVADDSLVYYYTTDRGARWMQLPNTSAPQGHLGFVSRSSDLVLSTQTAIYSLASVNSNLNRIDSGIINNDVLSLYLIHSNLYARTRDGFAWTSDGGDTWSTLASAARPGVVTQLAAVANDLFAGGSGLFRTSDQGVTWDTLHGGLNDFETVSALAASDSTIYAASSTPAQSRLFISKDLGKTWASADTNVPGFIYAIYANGPIVVILADDFLYRSTDHGTSWQKQSSPNYSGQLGISITGSGNTIIASAKSIYRSTDAGLNWNYITANLPDTGIDRVYMDGAVAVVGTPVGVFISKDSGATWHGSNVGLTVETPAASVDSRYVYAGTFGSSLWRIPRNQAFVTDRDHAESFSIYPNPARMIVSIQLSGGSSTPVRAVLYDALGRRVRSFDDVRAPINLVGVSSGIYQLELRESNLGIVIGRQKLSIVR